MGRTAVFFLVLALFAPRALAQGENVDVRITSTPSGASVEVVGRGQVGRTPVRRAALPPGEYDFVFTRRGYARTVVHAPVSANEHTINATLLRAGTIVVRAEHLAARDAALRLDGELVGRVPTRLSAAPGRRLIEVEADGYLTFSNWVELEPGRTATVSVRLQARPPDVGSIMVVADIPNAEVLVDGASRGRTPTVIEGVAPGTHRIEVIAPNGARSDGTVEVRASAREIFSVELASQPGPTGRLAVRSEPAGATVLFDGEPRGRTPLTIDQALAGAHRIEVSLDGYVSEQRVVTVEANQQAELDVTLSRGEPRPGRIVVRPSREGVFVVIDGLSRGRAPITLEQVQPGRHEVRVVDGSETLFTTQCTITLGETCTVEPVLGAGPVTVSVRAQSGDQPVPGARLSVDGRDLGLLPWRGQLAVGRHELLARATGFRPAQQTLNVVANMEAPSIVLAMTRIPPTVRPPQPEPVRARPRRSRATPVVPPEPQPFVPRGGAEPLPSGSGTASFFLGWPYLLGAEVAAGLPGPLDLTVAARTFGRLTELEVASRLGARVLDILALGGRLHFHAGFGPDEINSFVASLDARIGIVPIPVFAITAWIAVDLSSDEYPFNERDGSAPLTGAGRQQMVRGRVGGAIDWSFLPEWSLSLRGDGIIGSTEGRRRIYGDILELGNRDTEVYGELAAVYQW